MDSKESSTNSDLVDLSTMEHFKKLSQSPNLHPKSFFIITSLYGIISIIISVSIVISVMTMYFNLPTVVATIGSIITTATIIGISYYHFKQILPMLHSETNP